MEILPYLEANAVHDRYAPGIGIFYEPNASLGTTVLCSFQCPSALPRTIGIASFAPCDYALSLDVEGRPLNFADGLSATALAFESSNAGLGWIDGPTLVLSATEARASCHPGFHVLFTDGSVRPLAKLSSEDTLHALRTPDGGETVLSEP